MPNDREHAFSQGSKSTCYEHVCLVTANSGGTERDIIDGAANLKQQIGPSP